MGWLGLSLRIPSDLWHYLGVREDAQPQPPAAQSLIGIRIGEGFSNGFQHMDRQLKGFTENFSSGRFAKKDSCGYS